MLIVFGKRALLTLAAVAALGAVAFAADAQSRDHDQKKASPDGPIIIDKAHYEASDGKFCDARDAIQSAIGSRGRYKFYVSNDLCGDPSPQERKHLRVHYSCGNGTSSEVNVSESSMLELKC